MKIADSIARKDSIETDVSVDNRSFWIHSENAGDFNMNAIDLQGAQQLAQELIAFIRNHPDTQGVTLEG